MYPGYVNDQGHTFTRCQFCGDSENPNHAHCLIDLAGSTYCYRCGHSSHLSVDQYLYVTLGVCDIEEVIAPDWIPFRLSPLSSVGRRKTLLARYEVADNLLAEAFSMRNSKGELIGYQSRYPKKVMINEGNRGICWPGADDDHQTPLLSSKDNPLIVVEGSYDVLEKRFVAAMGSLSLNTMKHLKAQHIWAWPDPDILDTKAKRKKFIDMLNVANDNHCWVQGLIVSDKDPDVCKVKHRITIAQANEYVRQEYGA